jgi:hypothetical protein
MSLKGFLVVTVVAGILAPSLPLAAEAERRSTLAEQKSVAVTIYNDDLALVKDRRQVSLSAGENRLAFTEISALIRPETALLRSLSHPRDFAVLEQNFDFDLLTPETLLQKFVGKKVFVVRSHPTSGVDREEEAQVLSAQGGVVLKVGERIETGMPGRLAYPDVPENLRERPTLVTLLRSGTAKPQDLELSYLTGGLSWQADYVAELSGKDDRLDLTGWVTLTNRSGSRYPNARLQLVAGDVHRAPREDFRVRTKAMPMTMMGAEAPMAEEALFEYHLYTLERPTTLADNQTKQVALLSASQIPVRKEFRLPGSDFYYLNSAGDLGQRLKVGVFVEFENREKEGLGIPLPKGVVRVYKLDSTGAAQFVGEDRIDHTPKNDRVRLKLGEAFDVTADKKQTDFKKLGSILRYKNVFEGAFEIRLKNAKKEGVTVKVIEPIPGDWEMVEESHHHRKEDAGSAAWEIPVAAGRETVLTYRVRVRL